MKKPRYYVRTWDTDKQAFTPQVGVRVGPWSLWGLRKAIAKLRDMGYSGNRHNNPCVLIQREDEYEPKDRRI